MKKIIQDIKTQTYSRIYVIYGEDDYMKQLYVKKLKVALMDGADEMNCNVFSGKNIDENEVISIAQTMPFFADRRVIVIEDSGFFESGCSISDYFDTFADTTYFIFKEESVDKRSKMYKLAKNEGYISEMNGLDDKNMMQFVISKLTELGMSVTPAMAQYILEKVGTNMNMLMNEFYKLSAYTMERDDRTIRKEDVDAICTITLENRIFEMIDDLAFGRRDNAIKKYMDLYSLKESPTKILRLIIRHYNILLLITQAREDGADNDRICKVAKIPSFALKKYFNQAANYDKERLRKIIEMCVENEEKFKTGNLSEMMAVDMLMCVI